MTVALLDGKHADIVSALLKGLITRTQSQLAEEARQDGESLRQVVDRYEIDYAWHVMGSERMRDACVAALESRIKRPASAAELSGVAAVLTAAAAAQASDTLMSFDNDVAAHLDGLLAA